MDIAFYDKDNNETLFPHILVKDQEVTEIEELQGKLAPKGILLNANNYGYCKIGFDEASINYFKENTKHIESSLNRNLIYRYLWEHYKSNHMDFENYFTLIKSSLVSESSMNATVQLLNNLVTYVRKYTTQEEGKSSSSDSKSIKNKGFCTKQAFELTLDLFEDKKDQQELNQIADFVT